MNRRQGLVLNGTRTHASESIVTIFSSPAIKLQPSPVRNTFFAFTGLACIQCRSFQYRAVSSGALRPLERLQDRPPPSLIPLAEEAGHNRLVQSREVRVRRTAEISAFVSPPLSNCG